MKLNDKCFLQRLYYFLLLRILYSSHGPSIDKKWSRKLIVDRHLDFRLNLSQRVTYLRSIFHLKHVTYVRMGSCAVGLGKFSQQLREDFFLLSPETIKYLSESIAKPDSRCMCLFTGIILPPMEFTIFSCLSPFKLL